MAGNPVGWFEIYVDDMERAKKFYQSVLKVELTQLNVPGDDGMQMWSFSTDMEKYGASGALVKMNGMKAGGSGTLVYFSCEDCAVEEARIADAGGTVVQPKMDIGEYGFASMATDSEGNMFGLHSMK